MLPSVEISFVYHAVAKCVIPRVDYLLLVIPYSGKFTKGFFIFENFEAFLKYL